MMSQYQEIRTAKDHFFKTDRHSPLTPEQRKDFEGLSYFPENPALKLLVDVQRTENPQQITIQTSTGELQTYQRYGSFNFEIDGQEAQLTIFANQYGYFLPFVDSQAGDETYGAGRYLEPEEQPNGQFLIDFNMAYNPYCAYNEMWSCPLTPAENRLKVAIRAGEKNFEKHGELA
jgi:uncharacterized protein (DUF1684 family)